MTLPIQEFTNVCNTFSGKKCSTVDLKEYNTAVFDSKKNGHSCNCTFVFCMAVQLGLTQGGIFGKGVRGNPFYIVFQ